MIRKISSAILSVAILIAGIIAFGKLNYRESSLWVFKLNPSRHAEQKAERVIAEDSSGERTRGGRRGRAAGSKSAITENRRNENTMNVAEEIVPVPSEERTMSRGRRVRAFFPGEKKINLKNVLLYLAVFASFTVITIYTDRLFRFLSRHGKKKRQC